MSHADGDYSGVGQLHEERFLRGIQLSDAGGNARFQTMYPGWYPGRTPHINFKGRSSDDAFSAYEFTSQVFFETDLSKKSYTRSEPYDTRDAMDTTDARDGIYRRGGPELLLDLRESDEDYAATFDIAL